jgi:hypothetical protein
MNNSAIQEAQEVGTDLRSFMAHRGSVIVKESRPSGHVSGMYNAALEAETMILTKVKGAQKDVAFGVVLKHKLIDGQGSTTAFIDFDEIDELMGALEFVETTAKELLGSTRDYTEVTYATKDNAKFGFYQDNGKQSAYLSLALHDTMFLSFDGVDDLKLILSGAKNHLISCGAQLVDL